MYSIIVANLKMESAISRSIFKEMRRKKKSQSPKPVTLG